MSETLLQRATAFVDTSICPAKPAETAHRLPVGRVVKIGLAVTLLVGAATAMLGGQSRVTADNAVVSAYVLSVRSPIQGQVSGLQTRVGDAVKGATLLAHVSNDRVSDEHLTDLRSQVGA
jgi:hypothetical protein